MEKEPSLKGVRELPLPERMAVAVAWISSKLSHGWSHYG